MNAPFNKGFYAALFFKQIDNLPQIPKKYKKALGRISPGLGCLKKPFCFIFFILNSARQVKYSLP